MVDKAFSRHAWMYSLKRNRLSSTRAAKLVCISHNLTLLEQPKSSEKNVTAQTCTANSAKAKGAAHFSEPVHSGLISAAALMDYKSAALLVSEDAKSISSMEISLHDSSETDSEASVVK